MVNIAYTKLNGYPWLSEGDVLAILRKNVSTSTWYKQKETPPSDFQEAALRYQVKKENHELDQWYNADAQGHPLYAAATHGDENHGAYKIEIQDYAGMDLFDQLSKEAEQKIQNRKEAEKEHTLGQF